MEDHSAVDSFLGYIYQAYYALAVLLRAEDESSVSVETADDVVLHQSCERLHQIKHSNAASPPPLSIRSKDLWKTLAVWSSLPDPTSPALFLMTCATIQPDSSLLSLTIKGGDRNQLAHDLETEAMRITAERAVAKAAGKALPYVDRHAGCEAYLRLEPSVRNLMLANIEICPSQPNIAEIDHMISAFLGNVVRPERRAHVVTRLLEWWDRRVVSSLTGRLPRLIHKRELQERIQELISGVFVSDLPDDFGTTNPPTAELQLQGTMALQIELVRGGRRRIHRAAVARWKSRSQRARWMEEDVTIESGLAEFDNLLVQQWGERHGPMCDDCANGTDDDKCRLGRELLDWSHHDAPVFVAPPRGKRMPSYVIQGSYQELAENRRVGWHPDWEELLARCEKEKP